MANRLADETSPYLLQHQHNPVDWYPWGEEALALAKAQDKPILLSVGYSACHWCHVMERESFEDEATAAVMNAGFVNVKVDREERPDLDEIYMRAVQAFSGGRGGWPMTVFLTPDGTPYFAGTYFPPTPQSGMPSFQQVLAHASKLYREDKDQLVQTTKEMSRYLESSGRLPGMADEVGDDWLDAIVQAAAAGYDAARGGFGDAPKFPPHGTLAVLLAHHQRTGSMQSLAMATETLDAMAQGAMYDQLRGGFARYSVDPDWRIPHFEKMLYDNAQLLALYSDAWLLTENPLYERVVRETVGFVLRELKDESGGFWSALDADSEGEEGRFYAWTPTQVQQALADTAVANQHNRVCALLEVTAAGTFEHGSSALRLSTPLHQLSEQDQALLAIAMPAMQQAQDQRVRPGTDDKVLTGWNALMVGALAKAAAAFDEEDWFLAAARCAAFLLEEVTVDGRLMRTWKADPAAGNEGGGRAHIPAYADDHAFLVDALIQLHQCDYDPAWLRDANALCDQLLALFWDPADGGFFYTGSDAEKLITRSKHMMGGAEPSANGVAAWAMARLSTLSDRPELREGAEIIARCYRPLLEQAPRALGAEALAAAWLSGPTLELGIVGDPAGEDTAALVEVMRHHFLPFAVSAVVQADDADALAMTPWMKDREAHEGRATAYLCEGFTCQLPVQTPDELAAQLRDALAPPQSTPPAPGVRPHAPALPSDPALWINTHSPLSLEDLAGQIVVLDFWTSCCVNCLHVLPELAAIEARFADQPVIVIGVHSAKFPAEREAAMVRRAVRRHGIDHAVVNDPDQSIWKAYTVKSWPTVAVIDSTGRIAWQQPGEADRDTLGAVVQRLLDEGATAGSLAPRTWSPPTETLDDTMLAHPGKVTVFPDVAQQAMGADPFGEEARLYIADTGHNRIVEADLSLGKDGWPQLSLLRTFGSGAPGLLDARAPLARFEEPQGMARSGDDLWVADTGNHALRRIDLKTGLVHTVAGTGQLARTAPQGPQKPLQTALRSPWDVTVTTQGDGGPSVAFIAMAGSHQLWIYLADDDQLGPFVGSGREDHIDGSTQDAALAQPSGLVLFGRYLFFVDSETSSVRALDLSEHSVGTVVGRGLFDWGDIDGPPEKVRLQHPLGITLIDGDLFVADTFNSKIKRISLQGGHTSTLAGGNGSFCEPGGITAAGDFLIVADTGHHELKTIHRKTGEVRSLRLA